MTDMNFNDDENDLPSLSSSLSGACAMLHSAVCAEALRVIFALHFLSRSGVGQLEQELQRCHWTDADIVAPNNRLLVEGSAYEAEATASSLVEHYSLPFLRHRREGVQYPTGSSPSSASPLFERDHENDDESSTGVFAEVSFSTPAAARSCVERASQPSLLTAAHLLRCSSWTAASLTVTTDEIKEKRDAASRSPLPVPSAPTAVSQTLLKHTRALELLRTHEPGWCATALVRFTEWLLREVDAPNARARLADALSLTEYKRVDNPASTNTKLPRTLSSEERPAATWLLSPSVAALIHPHEERMAGELYTPQVVVHDALPLFFPEMHTEEDASTAMLQKDHGGSSSLLHRCCGHRWLLEDLPRWCVRVALEKHARLWHHHNVLRDALLRWRTRRGLRVMSHLSHAAEHHEEAFGSAVSSRDGGHQNRKREDKESQSSVLQITSYAASQQAAEEQSGVQGSKRVANIPLLGGKHQGGSNTSTGTVMRSAQGEADRQTQLRASPTVSLPEPAHAATRSTATTFEVSLLDRVLHQHSSELHPQDDDSDRTGRTVHEAVPASGPAPALGGIVYKEAQPTSSTHKNPHETTARSVLTDGDMVCSSGSTTSSVECRADVLPELPKREEKQARENRLVSQIQEQHNRNSLRNAFLHWRNSRLYESMATRYLQRQHQDRIVWHSWTAWTRRCAAARRRRKEARDSALGEIVTEQKAVQYFRRLLNVWRRAALARKFLMHSAAQRALHLWRCAATLVRYQRATRQPFVGAQRLQRQVWQRWCDRRLEAAAERQCARNSLTRTFVAIQARCKEQRALRGAVEIWAKAQTARVWHMWQTRLTRARQLHTSAHSAKREERLLCHVWKLWRARCLQREEQLRSVEKAQCFYVQQRQQQCFFAWLRRYGLEICVRNFASRRQRSSMLRPSFERWRTRAELHSVVRHGQEQLAWRVGEQLTCRKVVHLWRRRAATHAADRKAARAQQIEDDAANLARFNQLARTFYHWRTRQVVLLRYGVDRRRCLPESLRAKSLQLHAARALPLNAAIESAFTGVSRAVPANVMKESARGEDQPGANVPRQPPRSSPHSVASSVVSRSISPQARRCPTSTRTPQRSPQRRRGKPAVLSSTSVPATDRAAEKHRGIVSTEEGTGQANVAKLLAGKDRVVVQVPVPSLKLRGLALERQLFAVQRHTRLSAFGISLPSQSAEAAPSVCALADAAVWNKPAHLRSKPSGALFESARQSMKWHTRNEAHHRSSPLLRSPPDDSTQSSSATSDVDRQVPIRSHTATPLFAREKMADRSPKTAQRTSYFASDLVESPPQHLSRQPYTLNRRRLNGEADVEADFAPRRSSNRLLSQMELLLQRVRGIEAHCSSPSQPTWPGVA